jgi:hypothetical protein
VVLFCLERIDGLAGTAKQARPASDYFRRNVSVTPSGIWSERYLRWVIEMLGVERILFSTNYPYRFTSSGGARRFSEETDLSAAEKAAIAHGNWERLTENTQRGSQRALGTFDSAGHFKANATERGRLSWIFAAVIQRFKETRRGARAVGNPSHPGQIVTLTNGGI